MLAGHRSNNRWRIFPRSFESKVRFPLEVATAARDEVVHLLAALGADVNIVTGLSALLSQNHPERLDLLAWTTKALAYYDAALAKIEDDKKSQGASVAPEAPAEDTWSAYRAYVTKMQLFLAKPGVHAQRNQEMDDPDLVGAAKAYLEDVKTTLIKHGATPPPDDASGSKQPAVGEAAGSLLRAQLNQQRSGYDRHTQFTTEPVPLHLKAQYDELFEACWAGDNARIEELCLPRRVPGGSEPPIHISVHASIPPSLGRGSLRCLCDRTLELRCCFQTIHRCMWRCTGVIGTPRGWCSPSRVRSTSPTSLISRSTIPTIFGLVSCRRVDVSRRTMADLLNDSRRFGL